MLQVGFFKVTKGKRIFRMAPLHHHFEMLGWEEVTVVIRFWIITGLCVAAGLGIFYAEWVAGTLMRRPRDPRRGQRLLGRRPRGRRRLRRLRLRRRRQPHPPRRQRDRARRVRRRRQGREGRAARVLGADVRLGAGRDRDPARRRRPARHLARAGGPTAPLLAAGRARAASRSGARSSWPGGCATRTTPHPGSRSPAPTARPRPCRCSTRSCAPPACAASPSATSGCRSSRR